MLKMSRNGYWHNGNGELITYSVVKHAGESKFSGMRGVNGITPLSHEASPSVNDGSIRIPMELDIATFANDIPVSGHFNIYNDEKFVIEFVRKYLR
jgi:hypothetical protein